ncbi:MAG: hypothetical protein FWC91_02980 [Defluviitaleaceae bacterium]|nr:hypothetical protein [Defluviitaleaceae bacterium]
MIKIKFSKILTITVLTGSLYFSGWVGNLTTVYAQPGTPEDPLVSRSYINNRIAELEDQITQLTNALEAILLLDSVIDPNMIFSSNQSNQLYQPLPQVTISSGPELFRVVRAEPGMILIGEASTEIILRAGEATVIAGANGLANVTTGVDLTNGQAVPHNHLLIVPQADGRGLRFHTVAYLMVRGDYHFV